MNIMLETMAISALMSMVVALITTFVLTGGHRGILNFFMGLYGFTIGFGYGMAWLFLTGGLSYNLLTMLAGIIVTFVFVIIAYAKMPDVIDIATPKTGTMSTVASIASIIVVVVVFLFTLMPASYASSPNSTQIFTDLEKTTSQFEVDDNLEDLWLAGSTPMGGSIVTIDKRLSAINFPSLTTNPNEGDYLEVEITFSVTGGGNWEQPYVKLAIIEDANNNGQPDSGEAVWPSDHSKFVYEATSYMHWRTSVYWEGNSPGQQFIVASSGGQAIFVPIFHASTITQWMNDAGNTFSNTPEGYVPPFDQLSWELTADALIPKEDVATFSTISVGDQSVIAGKIYCPAGSTGNHLLLVMAFDMRFQTDPMDMSQTPISQSILTFSVGGAPPPPTDPPVVDITVGSWVTVGMLGLGGVGSFVIGRKYF